METGHIALEITDVHKAYGRQAVLKGVSLTVQQGESLGLVGLNGAGKTTLIKALLDFINIDSGTIRIFDVPQREVRSRKPLAFLPEHFMPPDYLKGREFLQMMARLYEVSPDDDASVRLMQALDLESRALDRPVRQYSKGMAQKLGLMACLLSQRPLLVMDEPMSGLDPKARLHFKQELQALQRQGRSLFFSTHLLADVDAVCDRMAILHDGRIVFAGTPAECRSRFGSDDLEQAYLECVTRGEHLEVAGSSA